MARNLSRLSSHRHLVDDNFPSTLNLETNLQLAGGRQLAARDGLEPHLVERVRGVGDQLPQEDVLVGVHEWIMRSINWRTSVWTL